MAILVLSQYVEERYASDLLAAGGAGIGYLLKERVADVGEFVESVRRVAEGGTAFDPEVVAQLLGRRRRDDPLSELTPREREVLSLMAEGLSNSAIAKRLWLTVGAVEKHISSIFGRLGLLPGDDENRRVRAVLTYLEGTRGAVGWRGRPPAERGSKPDSRRPGDGVRLSTRPAAAASAMSSRRRTPSHEIRSAAA